MADVRTMEPREAGERLAKALGDGRKPITVADASVASGLALRDAESGLAWLTSEYRGHLRVTDEGDLLHVFPHGFTKPWETQEALGQMAAAVGGALLGAGRFLVRAWLLVVMVGYALLFVGIMLALTLSRGSNDDRDHPGLSIVGALLRAIADAMFWTFHPFSPLYVEPVPYGYERVRQRRGEEEVRFYEKVNRFVFGPPKPAVDPHTMRARILEEIRAKKGRIGLADVMRVTGLPREQADPLMAQLMLDHDGTVEVGDQGGIVYRFEAMRRTADDAAPVRAPRPAWESPKELAPLTGNNAGANVAIVLLNGFNLLASSWALSNGLTIANLTALFSRHPDPSQAFVLPDASTPIALGVVPLVFSVALFAIPAVRALARARAPRKVAEENARLAILREVLSRAPKKEPVPDEVLKHAYRVATGEEPDSKTITKRVVELGGDVDTGPNGEVRYRFADLEAEAEALEEERSHAPDAEAKVGRVVFASDA